MLFVCSLAAALVTATAGPATADTLATAPQPPKTPSGFARCDNPIIPSGELPRAKGETFQYDVELLGLSLGTAHIATWRRGRLQGKLVTEYRAWVEPDPVVSAILKLEARAFAVVPDGDVTTIRSLTRYEFRGSHVEDDQVRTNHGRSLTATLDRNGKKSREVREFPDPVHDFLSGFLFMRQLPEGVSGCTVVYSEQRAYTIWFDYEGRDTLETAKGERSFDRYTVRYVSDKSRTVRTVKLWLTYGQHRIPFRAEAQIAFSPVIRLTGYRRGRR